MNSLAITPPSGSMFMTIADCLNLFTKPGSENIDSQREREQSTIITNVKNFYILNFKEKYIYKDFIKYLLMKVIFCFIYTIMNKLVL